MRIHPHLPGEWDQVAVQPLRIGQDTFRVTVTHEDHDDPCDALLSGPRRFDLSSIVEAYTEVYPGGSVGSRTLILVLTDPSDEHRPGWELPFTF